MEMKDRAAKPNDTLVVALDGNKLGQIGGMTLAIVVMAVCFYWRETDASTALIRSGWAFTAGYGGTFLLVRIILRTTLFEMLEQDRAKRSAKGLKRSEAAAPGAESS